MSAPLAPGTPFTFTVSLATTSATVVQVPYSTVNGSATAGSDYTAVSGTLTFAPGETSKTIVVSVNGDGLREGNEIFTVNLSNVLGAPVVKRTGFGTILNDDL